MVFYMFDGKLTPVPTLIRDDWWRGCDRVPNIPKVSIPHPTFLFKVVMSVPEMLPNLLELLLMINPVIFIEHRWFTLLSSIKEKIFIIQN